MDVLKNVKIEKTDWMENHLLENAVQKKTRCKKCTEMNQLTLLEDVFEEKELLFRKKNRYMS